jgi:hypothetical protein
MRSFPDSWSVTTKRPKSTLHILPYPVDLLWAKSAEVLSCTPSLDMSAGLLVGRTHLSGTAVSLIGGDPGVPMSHTPPQPKPTSKQQAKARKRKIKRNSPHPNEKKKQNTTRRQGKHKATREAQGILHKALTNTN